MTGPHARPRTFSPALAARTSGFREVFSRRDATAASWQPGAGGLPPLAIRGMQWMDRRCSEKRIAPRHRGRRGWVVGYFERLWDVSDIIAILEAKERVQAA